MTDTPDTFKIDLQEVLDRNTRAREFVRDMSVARPTLASLWRYLETALTDTLALAAQVSMLRADLSDTRLERANLAAAARATLAAHLEGEPDPLAYLRDELTAQGFASQWKRH